jgi:hypothetical protein
MIEYTYSHTIIRVDDSKRRDYWEYQIIRKSPKPRKNAFLRERPPLQDVINKERKDWTKKVKAIYL